MSRFERSPVNITFRIWCSFAVALISVGVLVARLWYLQIEQGAAFRDRSENNRLRTLYVPAARGLILDRHGEVLVRNRPSFNVELVVEDSPDPAQSIAELAEITGEDPAELQARAGKQGKRRRYEPRLILRDVPRDLVARISAQKHRLPGVAISVVPTRDYPHGGMSAHVFGYIREVSGDQLKSPLFSGYLPGDTVGQYGVEADLERYLRGERGARTVIVNARGSKIGEAFASPEKPGADIVLTIDRKVQAAADEALAGKHGAVVAMDPATGEILALASAPQFSPAAFTSEMSKEAWAALVDPKENRLSNRALQGAFPPGSVFKIFVAAAALNEGVVSPAEKVWCPGHYQFGKRSFKCHKHSGHGSVNMFDAIVQSCDVYFYVIGQRLGVDRIFHYAHDLFGLGQPTRLTEGDENAGVMPSTKWKESYFRREEDKKWYPGETLSVAIGQGAVSTTPVQLARALAAVVNGGKLLKPRLVKRVVAGDGRVIEEFPAEPEVIGAAAIEPEAAKLLEGAMVGVVAEARGTGHRAALPKASGIQVGGKTGTAQVASRESGVKEEDHAWFAGYAPAESPRIVVVALVENGGHGGVAAAPIARKVMAAFFGVADEDSPPPVAAKPRRPAAVAARAPLSREG